MPDTPKPVKKTKHLLLDISSKEIVRPWTSRDIEIMQRILRENEQLAKAMEVLSLRFIKVEPLPPK